MANIIQWNIRGLRANYSELQLLQHKYQPVAICLQELLIPDSYLCPNRQYCLISKLPTFDNNNRPTGGSGILIRKDIPYSTLTLDTPLQAVACRISTPEPITLCSIYLPPTSTWNFTDLLSLVSQLPPPILLLGDFNSHSTLWGCRSTCPKGTEIETFLMQSNLCLLNGKQPTYLHPATGTLSSLDLAFCDPSLYLNYKWSPHDDLCGSDHYPIIISKPITQPLDDLKRWKLDKADWASFESMCSSELSKYALDQASDKFQQFTSNLLEIANKTIPKTSGKLKVRQKPWFDEDCKVAAKDCKHGLKTFLRNPTQSNLVNIKILRAKARRTIRTSRRTSWRTYVSKLNSNTSSKKVWEMVKRISGKNQPTPTHHLVVDNNKIEHPQDIVNTIASTFAFNSSPEHLTKKFQRTKIQQEKQPLRLQSDNSEPYNQPFSDTELLDALHQAHDAAVGPDEIHYQMLKHLPHTAKDSLLDIFNTIWLTGCFPPSWSVSTVIPLPKPDKDHTSPNNYRPISLTSCMCKTFERMVSTRLTWYLETNKILTEIQSGFRKQRGTTDQLVRLESFVREAFVHGEHAVSIYFDLEKAYDTTWKYGILRDLQDAGLKGRLPIFISNFLENRTFRVRVGSCLSDSFKQEMGVPQGGVLSVVLFILKINNIIKCLPPGVRGSLFVDDLLICYRSKSMRTIERVLQRCLGNIESWADDNGFKFSQSKTACMHFCNKRTPHPEPSLKLYNSEIPVVQEAKFLGVIFDSKLTFKPHIANLKKKCLKAMNLLRVVAHTDWGADSTTLLRLYRSLIRSKLDYGCIVYGSARESYLQSLDRVQNAALRVCLGAFRTTPITSLHVEANELPLSLRREKLALQYIIKLRNNPCNPSYAAVFQPNFKPLFEAKPNAIPTLGIRMHQALKETGVNLRCIAPYTLPSTPPWLLHQPCVNYTLYNLGTKSDISPEMYLSTYHELSSIYPGSTKIYTDGSKKGKAVSAAAVTVGKVLVKRLPDHASIFSAEARAILLALDIVHDSPNQHFLILSDSLSCLQSIENRNLQNPLILEILENLDEKLISGRNITFVWVPSHVGIAGNTAADATAKAALCLQKSNSLVPYSDFKPLINTYAIKCWQQSWNAELDNKLHKIQNSVNSSVQYKLARRDEVILHRLRVGHTYLTHSFLLHKELPPECDFCHLPLTVEHILITCSNHSVIRSKYFDVTSINELFEKVRPRTIVDFIREIGLYHKI